MKKFLVLVVEAPLAGHLAEHMGTDSECPVVLTQAQEILERVLELVITPKRVTGSIMVIGDEKAGDEATAALYEYADALKSGKVRTTYERIGSDGSRLEDLPKDAPPPPFSRRH